MANAVRTLVSAFNAGALVAQSGAFTFSFAMTNGEFGALVPFLIGNPSTANHSAGHTIMGYRSSDRGLTYETEPVYLNGTIKPSVSAQMQRADVWLDGGYWLVAVQVGGGVASTWSVNMGTAEVTTAYA